MARVIEISRWQHSERRDNEPALVCAESRLAETFHYWRGASGKRYLHSVYTLLACPLLPRANYLLVHRRPDGERTVLAVGQTTDDAASLNLARLRHDGARLGANEVHIHLLAEDQEARDDVEMDLSPLTRTEMASCAPTTSALAV